MISRDSAPLDGGEARERIRRSLSLYNLLYRAGSNLLFFSLMTLLLKRAGPGSLPWLYTASNLILIVTNLTIAPRFQESIGLPLLRLITWPMAIACVFMGFHYDSAGGAVLLAMLILISQIDEFWSVSFSGSMSRLLTLGESKRWQASIYAAGSLGQFASGIVLKFLLDVMGMREIFIVTLGLIACSDVFLSRLAKEAAAAGENRHPTGNSKALEDSVIDPEDRQDTRQENSAPDSGSPPSVLRLSHPLVSALVAVGVVRIFCKYPLDFLYASSINSHFSSPGDLASFMGIFGSATDLAVIGVQTLAAGRLLSAFPIGKVLFVMPATLTILFAAAAWKPGFAMVVFLQFLLCLFSRSFFIPASNILVGAFPSSVRGVCQRYLFISRNAGTLASGTALIFLKDVVPQSAMFVTLALACALMAWLASRLDRAYLPTLRETLSTGSGETGVDLGTALEFVSEKDREKELVSLLGSPVPSSRMRAIEQMTSSGGQWAVEAVLNRLPLERDWSCLQMMVSLISTADEAGMERVLSPILQSDPESRYHADLLEALGRTKGNAWVEGVLSSRLDHPHHRVAGSSIMGLLRITRSRAVMESALEALARLSRSSQPVRRATAAAVMGDLALPMFLPSLSGLAHDPDESVFKSSLRAISRLSTPSAASILEDLGESLEGARREIAKEAAVRFASDNLMRLGTVIGSLSTGDRKNLNRDMRAAGGGAAMVRIMAKALALEHHGSGSILAATIRESGRAGRDLLDRCLIADEAGDVRFASAPLLNAILTGEYEKCLPRATELVLLPAVNESERDHAWFKTVESLRGNGAGLTARAEAGNSLIGIAAGGTKDPEGVLTALKSLLSDDRFAQSIGLEYLENALGAEKARVLAELARECDSGFSTGRNA